MRGLVEQGLLDKLKTQKGLFIVLLDPDAEAPDRIVRSGLAAAEAGADALFLGGSFMGNPDFSQIAQELKSRAGIPIILFPGGSGQVIPGPDAILFTTLISGRNSQYLIEEQVKAAFLVRRHRLEPIPTAYMLVESGRTTAVEYISNTRPLPRDKPALAAAHALAGQMLGLRWAYLEAGSGALHSVPPEMIAAVRNSTNLTVIAGGGIRTPEDAGKKVAAGAHAVVVGTLFETEKDGGLMRAFAEAVHQG